MHERKYRAGRSRPIFRVAICDLERMAGNALLQVIRRL